MPVAQRSAISFGLVYIPVELYTAVQNEDIQFNQLARANGERVKYVKTCASCKAPLTGDDIVKGFQYEKGKYVVVTDEDFEAIKTEKDRSIQIVQFVDMRAIPTVYFEKAYRVLPQAGGEKAFALLREAMQAVDKVAIGRTVLGAKETMLALMPEGDAMLMQTLYYADEIKGMPREVAQPSVSDAEMGMAKQLIESMAGPFEPAQYKDEYQLRLRALIETKIAGQAIVAPTEAPAQGGNVIDLMDALKASLAAQDTAKSS